MANLRNRDFEICIEDGGYQTVRAAYWMVGGSGGLSGSKPEADGFVVFKAINHDIVFGIRVDQVKWIREVFDKDDN